MQPVTVLFQNRFNQNVFLLISFVIMSSGSINGAYVMKPNFYSIALIYSETNRNNLL